MHFSLMCVCVCVQITSSCRNTEAADRRSEQHSESYYDARKPWVPAFEWTGAVPFRNTSVEARISVRCLKGTRVSEANALRKTNLLCCHFEKHTATSKAKLDSVSRASVCHEVMVADHIILQTKNKNKVPLKPPY